MGLDGFFAASDFVDRKPLPLLAQCGECGLFKTCRSPKMPPSGQGKKGILILAEAPGKDEDAQGVQLVGNSGKDLERAMRRYGVDMRRDCTLTNSLICRPPNNKITDGRWVDYCRPNVIRTVKEKQPEVIILLGATAIESLMRWAWKDESTGGVSRWAGYQIPSQKLNAWICPTFHPAALLHSKDRVMEMMFHRHLEAACRLSGRPWKKVPDYAGQVERIFDGGKAATAVLEVVRDSPRGDIAFDYETTTLKPDGPHARIVTCSVSNGSRTVAFPWHGEVIKVMKEVLTDPEVIKVAQNAKFEDRWSRAKLGIEVAWGKGWRDTMLVAHGIENADKARKITSIKFQAYVHLGLEEYDGRVVKFLHGNSDNNNSPNQIHRIGLNDLLLYNGLDSLVEYKVARVQRRMTQ